MATRMRQTLAEFEQAFVEEAWQERDRRDVLRRKATVRSQQRRLARQHKRGSLRFWLLIMLLVGVAVGVTVAMFETLYLVLG